MKRWPMYTDLQSLKILVSASARRLKNFKATERCPSTGYDPDTFEKTILFHHRRSADDYISLMDIAKYKNPKFPRML